MMRNIETTETERNLNTLPSGKQLGIYKVANSALYCIKFTSGGELPKELDGMWTDAYRAQKVITSYLEKRELEAELAKAAIDVATKEEVTIAPATKKTK